MLYVVLYFLVGFVTGNIVYRKMKDDNYMADVFGTLAVFVWPFVIVFFFSKHDSNF